MSLKNFEKYISTNLISLCGYVIFLLSLKYLIFDIPYAIKLDKVEQIKEGITHTFKDATVPYLTNCVCIILAIIFLCFCFFLEIYLKNNKKINTLKFFEYQNKFKSILFLLGYILIPFPIYIYLTIFLYIFISLVFWSFR